MRSLRPFSSVRSMNQAFETSFSCWRRNAQGTAKSRHVYVASGKSCRRFVAEVESLHTAALREPSRTLFASFQLAIEVTLGDYCREKDRTSPRGSGILIMAI